MLDKEIDIIDRYFQLDLNDEELDRFDKKLSTDEDFRLKVEQYKYANDTAYEVFLPGHKEKLLAQKEAMRNYEIPNEKSRVISSKWRWIAVAASVALLMTLGYLFFPKNSGNLLEAQAMTKQMAKQSVNLDIISNTGTRSDNVKTLDPILSAYKSKDYREVVELSNDFVSQVDILFLRGLAFVEVGEKEKAINTFQALIALPFVQKDVALWWLANLHLEKDKVPEAKQYLQQLIDGEFPSSNKAQEALELIRD